MKSLLFVTAIMFAGAAAAQTTTYQTTTTTSSSGQVVQPSNASPELDARGIPVVSDPAVAPAGFNSPPGMGGPMVDASSRPAPQPATENYPACSRTVTDNCVQTYERGRRPN